MNSQQVNVSVSKDNATTKTTTTTTTTSSNGTSSAETTIQRGETVSFRSKAMGLVMKNWKDTSLNLNDCSAQLDEEFKELKEYIILRPVGNYALYDTICAARLSDVERDAEISDITVKKRLYSAVILDNKKTILSILKNEFDSDSMLKADHLMLKLKEYLVLLADEILEISESFEENIINKESESNKKIKKLKSLSKR